MIIGRDDDIVISGIAGRFPKSCNVDEFAKNMYEKVDMLSDDCRWSRNLHPDTPRRHGLIDDVNKFDASFFKMNPMQVERCDPQGRILLELAYEAILDAGLHPATLRGTNTAVFTCAALADASQNLLYAQIPKESYSLLGSSNALLANRISFSLGLRGVSMFIDDACCSSIIALQTAINSIRLGQCDAALVCATNLAMLPHVSASFLHLGVLDKCGVCRPFDNAADGYVRSEAVVVVFLQKRKSSKRIYANVVKVVSNSDGFKSDGICHPSGESQSELFKTLYDGIKISPLDVHFIEAHSTGTQVGDLEECSAISNFYRKNRTEPLLVGSHKSNMGHSEAASGLCSIIKAIYSFETGLIPPNMHYRGCRKDIPTLVEGWLKVCSETTPLQGSLIAVNSFGFGGVNTHTLLKEHSYVKINGGKPDDNLPRIVTWAGRTHDAVNTVFAKLKSIPIDAEFIGLLQNIQRTQIIENLYRGYIVLSSTNSVPELTVRTVPECLSEEISCFDEVKRPIVWLFTGMGAQWIGMGRSLLQIQCFRDSIQICNDILKQFDINLISILTTEDETVFDNILHSFVGITAIQIALVDLLKLLKISADFYIGHSVGELGCAYADGALCLKETILASYFRGKVSLDEETLDGRMAAIGLSYDEIKNQLPQNISVACRNSCNSCTISGPSDAILRFMAELKSRNIFVKEVHCNRIAFHSNYIAKMGLSYLEKLEKVIPTKHLRSSKWLSTSIPVNEWHLEKAKFNSAEYHVNNLLSPVYFEETSALLPKNSIIIEVAPHGLMQSIMRRALPDAVNVPLTQRNHQNNSAYLMGALGKLFMHGVPLQVYALYPEIDFPVSRGTPRISPLIKWNHDKNWPSVISQHSQSDLITKDIFIDTSVEEFQYLTEHIVDGQSILSGIALVHFVRELLCSVQGASCISTLNVEFKDVNFHRAIHFQSPATINLSISVHSTTGYFEVVENKIAVVVTGIVSIIKNPTPVTDLQAVCGHADIPFLTSKQFYKEIGIRGFKPRGSFQSVHSARSDGCLGKIRWNNNWVTFLDGMCQVAMLATNLRSRQIASAIRYIKINATEHLNWLKSLDDEGEEKICDVYYSKETSVIVCGGIEIAGVKTIPVERRKQEGVEVLESYTFVPFIDASIKYELDDAVTICVQLAIEKLQVKLVKLVEVLDGSNKPMIEYFHSALARIPLVLTDLILLTDKKDLSLPSEIRCENLSLEKQTQCTLIVMTKCSDQRESMQLVKQNLVKDGFLLSLEDSKINHEKIEIPNGFTLISVIYSVEVAFALLQLTPDSESEMKVISIDSNDYTFQWLKLAQEATDASKNVLLVAENRRKTGVLGLINCLRLEPDCRNFQCLIIDDTCAPQFTMENKFYKAQIALKMPINIYIDGVWGTYRHLALKDRTFQKKSSKWLHVDIERKGDLHTLKWVSSIKESPLDSDVVRVQYLAINLRNAMTASCVVSKSHNLQHKSCCEFSGVVASTGKRVMGVYMNGPSLATCLPYSDGIIVLKVPDAMTLRDAATIPLAYTTVYNAFFINNTLATGQSILIHSGSGGIGMAAIRVSLAYGLRVFTTVSSKDEREFLLQQFPQLKETDIGNSHDCSFEQLVMNQTNGEGVEFVLNSLTEEKLKASIRCIRDGGTFFEIGNVDIANMELNAFEKCGTFRTIFVDKLATQPLVVKQVIELMERDLHKGIIQPLPSIIFVADDVEKAFSCMAAGRHVGKVLLQIRQEENSEMSLPVTISPTVTFHSSLVYIVVGGLGGFGLELVDWMVLRGAKRIVLNSRRGVTNAYQKYRINLWKSYSCEITLNNSDAITLDGCLKLLTESMIHGHIGGIFNLAVVLRDGILVNQTSDSFREAFAPKVMITSNLDSLSRIMCPNLEYFVVFSSIVCGRGNPGQCNYGMANSVMERIVEQRVLDQLPGKAFQWGPISDVGILADWIDGDKYQQLQGTLPQRINRCLDILDRLFTCDSPIVSSMQVGYKQTIEKLDILQSVFRIIGISDQKFISTNSTLSDFGLDSLMNVEIKRTLEREFAISMTSNELKELTVAKLKEISNANRSKKL